MIQTRQIQLAPSTDGGFTLIEILVALAVFSIACIALMTAQNENIRTAGYLGDKAYADIAAENLMIETLTNPAALSVGFETGETRIASYNFRWQRQIAPTTNAAINRVEINIFRENGEQSLSSLTALRKAS